MNDTVALIIDNDSLHPVIKALAVTPGAARFAGIWHWTGGQHRIFRSGPPTFDSSYSINDTTFTITAVNDSSIMVWGYQVPFSWNMFTDRYVYDPFNGPSVYKENDTIFFSFSAGGLGGQDIESYHTP